MRELERELSSSDTPACTRLAIVGPGRLGTALARALETNRAFEITGPLHRDGLARAAGADAVLLTVPDAQIATAARAIPPGPLLGHCSGATGVDVLGSRGGFVLHPLMTVTAHGARFTGAGAAIAGTTPEALEMAERLAAALELDAIRLAETDRPAYHAAASIASNFLVALEAAAERLAATAGVSREMLVPLVRATVENWAELGPERALTGPVARGDEQTVARQRRAVAERTPELLELFDAMVSATRALAAPAPPAHAPLTAPPAHAPATDAAAPTERAA